MFSDLRTFGRLTNREAAEELLSAAVSYGGKSIRARIDDRTFLSRQIVHAAPGQTHPEFFGDFFQSAQTITGRIINNLGGDANARASVDEHYRGPAADAMCAVLHDFDLEDTLYANAVARIAAADFRQESDRTILFVMLFLATGCLADTRAAVSVVERFVEYKLAMDIGTIETEVDQDASVLDDVQTSDGIGLGLLRIINGVARPPIYPLSDDPKGTIIGSLADGENVINDVDLDVSRRHLRIWRDGKHWFAEGLDSTNGTTLIPGDGTPIRTIEKPRSQRGAFPLPPVEIHNSDMLNLAGTTAFLVVSITS